MERYEQYVHHGRRVWVRRTLKGKHRNHCLCYACAHFNPGETDNCPIASHIYSLCVLQDMVLPVWECPHFYNKNRVCKKP